VKNLFKLILFVIPSVSLAQMTCPEFGGTYSCKGTSENTTQILGIAEDEDNKAQIYLITDGFGWIADGKSHEIRGSDGNTTRYTVTCEASSVSLQVNSTKGDSVNVKFTVTGSETLDVESESSVSGKQSSAKVSCSKLE